MIVTLFFGSLILSACTKNETSQSTEPADYAETRDKLIQNRANDSLAADSLQDNSAMPPQTEPDLKNQ